MCTIYHILIYDICYTFFFRDKCLCPGIPVTVSVNVVTTYFLFTFTKYFGIYDSLWHHFGGLKGNREDVIITSSGLKYHLKHANLISKLVNQVLSVLQINLRVVSPIKRNSEYPLFGSCMDVVVCTAVLVFASFSPTTWRWHLSRFPKFCYFLTI